MYILLAEVHKQNDTKRHSYCKSQLLVSNQEDTLENTTQTAMRSRELVISHIWHEENEIDKYD